MTQPILALSNIDKALAVSWRLWAKMALANQP